MALRKQRLHCTGVSNADFRVTAEWQQRRTLRADLHESKKKYHELQLGILPAPAPPVDLTRTRASLTQTGFYKTVGKPVRSHPVLSHTQTSPLKGLNLFVGGDNDPFIHKAEGLHPPSQQETPSGSARTHREKYRKTKDVEHQGASQETQLVHIQHAETLEGKVDLAKVVDIRRTIRRRYANRSNFRAIFNQWDSESLGVIRPADVFNMVNKLGIPLNQDEARVLVASANQSGSGVLTLEEFLQLIFDDSDRLNVDLSLIKADPGAENSLKPEITDTMLADLHELAVNQHSRTQQEQLKLHIKERLSDVTGQMLKMDKSRSGIVTFERFCEVMNNLGLPQSVSNEKMWNLLYVEAGGKEVLRYRDFMKEIEAFEPGEDAVNKFQVGEVSPKHPLLAKRGKSMQTLPRLQGPGVLDPQRVPVNKSESIVAKSRRICGLLKEKYENEGALQTALEQAAGGVVSQDQLRAFVGEMAMGVTPQVSRGEMDSFLSRYIYNKQKQTSVKSVVSGVFSEDAKPNLQLERRVRAIPPTDQSPSSLLPPDKSSLKRVLQALDEKVFTQGVFKSFPAYKIFDSDNDGYINFEDLRKGLTALNIPHSPEEAMGLMRLLDADNKGFVEFHEFAQVVKPDTVYQNSLKFGEKMLNYPNYVQPSKEFLDTQLARAPAVNQAYEELRTRYKPLDMNFSLKPNSRFSATPSYKDTFTSFVPPEDAGMYLSAKDRFNTKNRDPINVGNVDRGSKLALQEAKSERIRETVGKLQERIKKQDERESQMDEAKVTHRAAFREEYEKRCHLYSAP